MAARVPDTSGGAGNLFGSLLAGGPTFKNREILREGFTPSVLVAREPQARALATLLADALRGSGSNHVLVHGPRGAGRTVFLRWMQGQLWAFGEQSGVAVTGAYVDCGAHDTTHRVLAQLANAMTADWRERVPPTGWPTSEVLDRLVSAVSGRGGCVVLFLDNVDVLFAKEGEGFASLLREVVGRASARVCVVSSALRPSLGHDRGADWMCENHVHLPAYTFDQVVHILRSRASGALVEGALHAGAVEACAAASDGDAMLGVRLLRYAAEAAERAGAGSVCESDVRLAFNRLSFERRASVIRHLPLQQKLVMLASMMAEEAASGPTDTGSVYEAYVELASDARTDVLTMRRVTDLVGELSAAGLLASRVVSRGRHGRTKEIRVASPPQETRSLLMQDGALAPLFGEEASS